MSLTADRLPGNEAPPRRWVRIVLAVIVLALIVMWVYAFAFAPRDGVNPVRDKAWTDSADSICTKASADLKPLVFKTKIEGDNKEANLPVFVSNLDKGYVIISTMLDDLESLPRVSDKAQALVPQWITDYRMFQKNLHDWIEELRVGKMAEFSVGVTDTGIPVNERINTFAAENHISSCGTDLLGRQ